MAETDEKPHSTDRLRHDIDAGEAGDKKGFPDTSASPLGTDDEASGNPNTEEQVKMAQAAETENPARGEAKQASGAKRPVTAEHGGGRTSTEQKNRNILIAVTVGTALVLTIIALLV
ncbi:hypothetical protein [Limimaricola pyoseonensis]|uniref:Uncharacterized protein n=1 Tax=Limimaricola pyoseonensis TaxID=521013 RepID=A0A1G7IV98_9RHOB|nr:hypothetical protein [Limimaricola pyoseonensis]SDF16229.1 hypothetical protein SAMN04488567_3529 [Limimaricola pyoseonensis]